MENASKALIMAGGMLLAMLIVSLLIYAWSLFSKYQASQEALADIEDTAKFNNQFTDYDRDGVKGYEIVSLVNKIRDYNSRKSANSTTSSEKYTSMDIWLKFSNENERKTLTTDGGSNKLILSDTNNIAKLTTIIDTATRIEKKWGGSDSASKIAKGIGSIFVGNSATDEKKNEAIRKFNSLNTNSQYAIKTTSSEITAQYKNLENNEKEDAYKYYEYMQLKRSLFNSSTSEIAYDQETGRIIKMVFNFDKIY